MNTNSLHTAVQWKEKGINYLLEHGGAILSGIVIFFVGILLANWTAKLVLRSLEKPLLILIGRVVRLVVIALATLVALQTCGVDLLPLIAGMGVVGVGIGLAMQGVLGNVVAGLCIIFTKPFRIGEYIRQIESRIRSSKIEIPFPQTEVRVLTNENVA